MAGANMYRTSITLLAFSVLVVTSLKTDINIICGEGDTCVQDYKLHQFSRSIRYDGSDILNGMLHHGIQIASSGKCFTPKFVFRGLSDLVWHSWYLEELDNPTPANNNTGTSGEELKEFFKKKGTPSFERKDPNLILCQSMAASREIVYKPCGGTEECKVGGGEIEKGTVNCRRYYTTTQINPVLNWLDKKADEGNYNYPTVEFANDTHISIDWGKAKEFKCGEDIKNNRTNDITNVSGDFKIVFEDPDQTSKSVTITQDRFKFEKDYIEIRNLTTLDEPRCYTFSAKITLTLTFLELGSGATHFGKSLLTKKVNKIPQTFSTIIQSSLSSNGPNGQNDLEDNSKIKTNNKTQTFLFIQHEDKEAPINCLQKKVTVKYKNENPEEVIIEEGKVNLTSFINVACEETEIKIVARNMAKEKVIEKLYTFLPTVNATTKNTSSEDRTGHLIVNEAKFERCADLKFEVVCEALDEASDKNITNREILGYNETTKKSDEFKMEGKCKARAFLCKGTNETCSDKEIKSEWTYFYGQPSPKIGSETVIGSVMGSIFGVLAITAAVVMFTRFKEKKNRKEDKEKLLGKVKVKTESGPIPDHVVFQKDENLGNYLIDITNLQNEVMEEFNALENYDEKNIKGQETTKTATSEINLGRNRYKDMVPYDSKIVLLNKATGDPPSRYINASIIKFPTCDQKFLAVQAPKLNMFSGFWQLVMEHNVTVIVMITGLVEGGKVKAHQYWPDDNDTKMKLDNGIEVELISVDKTRSVYHHRQFKVTSLSNVSITVDHLLCVEWEDMTAPKDTKVLRDLVEQADLLVDDNPGAMMVHCSAGVGRTGTFIGYYKMTQDNNNNKVDKIDPFETVLEMRRARTKMVQKPLQYHYMMKCLADHVTGETSVYS